MQNIFKSNKSIFRSDFGKYRVRVICTPKLISRNVFSNWFAVKKIAGYQGYVVGKKIAEKSLSRLLLLFVFMLFYLEYMKTYS